MTLSTYTKVVIALLALCLGLTVAVQAQQPAAQPEAKSLHVLQYAFNLAPGASYNFTLPDVKSPIRIEISNPSLRGGVQTPSEVMWALVDFVSGNHVTWIGTNSDGTSSGSNSLQNTVIGNIVCGPNCVIATLSVTDAYTGTLTMTQNETTTAVNGAYIIRLYY